MSTRLALLDLVTRRNLDAKTAAALWDLAGFDVVPERLLPKARWRLLIVGAACTGLGLIFGVAANWALLSRFQQFALLQALVLAPCAALALWSRGRVPLALLAFIAIGALFAYFGQTYPTGADDWQLFALWAALGLPLAVCARTDGVWSAWAVVALAGVALWDRAHIPFGAPVDATAVHATAAVSALLLTAAVSPIGHRYTGAGRWAFGIALVLTMLFMTTTGLVVLHHTYKNYYGICVVLTGVAAFAITRARPSNAFAAGVVALSLVVLVAAGIKVALWPDFWSSFFGPILVIGLAPIGLTFGAVKIMRMVAIRDRRHGPAAMRMSQILRAAVAQGLLDDGEVQADRDELPWPIVAFAALAAWLAVVPLTVLILLVTDRDYLNIIGELVGIPLLVVAVVVLRKERIPLFVEQLGLPVLLTGGSLVAFEVCYRSDSLPLSLILLVPIAGVVAALVPQAWVRTLMGAAIGVLSATSLSLQLDDKVVPASWLLWLPAVACAVLLDAVQRQIPLRGRSAHLIAGLHTVSSGVAVAALVGIAWSSGHTFMVTKAFGDADFASMLGDFGRALSPAVAADRAPMRALGAALAACAGGWLAWRWPPLRTSWHSVLVGLAALTSWFVPALGPVLLILCMCLASGRPMLAALAGICASWLIGALYYRPEWTLEDKAQLLVFVGMWVGLLAWYAIAHPAMPAAPSAGPRAAPIRTDRRTLIKFLSCSMLVLGVANTGIWQKESLLGTGARVYVALDLSDPRSIMQGDYMALSFALPWPKPDPFCIPDPSAPPPSAVVARKGQHGIAQLVRLYDGGQIAPEEFLIELVYKHQGLTIVTDAWYVKEGEAERWRRARYGEFRVAPDGQALLVGLRGANLERL